MKNYKFLFTLVAFIAYLSVSCKKKSDDPVGDNIKAHASEIKFTFKKDGIVKDWNMYSAYSISNDTIIYISGHETGMDTSESFNITINQFKGEGIYNLVPVHYSCLSGSVVYFSHHGNITDQYCLFDSSAFIKIEKFDIVNNFIQGTFEARKLGFNDSTRISITEGEFYIGRQFLYYAQHGD